MNELDLAGYGLVDPTDPAIRGGAPAAAREPAGAPSAAGYPPLRDARIEFFWNGKSNGDILLSTLERTLVEKHHIHSLGQSAKILPNTAAPEAMLAGIAARASLVFTGPGD
jgi:hypothetical protein